MGGGHFEAFAHRRDFPAVYAPPPAPAPAPKAARAPRAPRAAPAAPAAAGGISAADMAMLQQVFAAAIKAEMGK